MKSIVHDVQCWRILLGVGRLAYATCIGSGQTRSWQSGGQNSLILSYKYCCHYSESPGVRGGDRRKISCCGLPVLVLQETYFSLWTGDRIFHNCDSCFLVSESDVVHGFYSLKCWYFEFCFKELGPVVCRHNHLTILCAYKLSMIDYGRALHHLDDIVEAPDFCSAIGLLKQTKTPVWRDLGVDCNQESQCDLFIEANQDSPG